MKTNVITDNEFGDVKLRRNRGSFSVKLRMDAKGTLSVSLPFFASTKDAMRLINAKREFIRKELAKLQSQSVNLIHGDVIGKTHRLSIEFKESPGSKLEGTILRVFLEHGMDPESPAAQNIIKKAALKALRVQAKSYLPRRLMTLADLHNFSYSNVRFSNAGTRWGSCSSSGTISLNIWLMHLEHELIDYVLIHELCHTREMNHSQNFWVLVENILPNFKALKKELKTKTPYI